MIPRRISVLYFDNSLTFGGAIHSLDRLVRGLEPDQFRSMVVSAQHPEYIHKLFTDIPTEYWPVKLSWVHNRHHRRLLQLPGFRRGPLRSIWDKLRSLWWLVVIKLPEALWVARFARKRGVDLIHLNNGVEGMLGPLLGAKLARIPVVAHSRGPQSTSGINRLYVRMPDQWIAVSEHMAGNLRQAGVDESRINVVYNAASTTEFTDGPPPSVLRRELGLPPEGPVFGVFGRVIPWKGIREFVLAACEVLKDVPGSCALVVGDRSDGNMEYYREVVELGRELGIHERLFFTGFRNDVADVMRLCDVVVHTSIDPEPFGLTIVEGMATGKPVVAANAGGPVEILEPGETGYLVDPTDTRELSAAIIRLLREPELAAAMGRRAARRAHAYYSPTRYASEVADVYVRVLHRGGATGSALRGPGPSCGGSL